MEEVENLIVRDDWWNDIPVKNEDYYNNMPDYMEEEWLWTIKLLEQ